MGKSNSKQKKNKVKVDEIIENINSFFKGMKIRQMDIKKIEEELISLFESDDIIDKEKITKFLKNKINNEEYKTTSMDLIRESIQDAKENYKVDETIYEFNDDDNPKPKLQEVKKKDIDYKGIILPIFSILILANSNKEEFIEIFKNINKNKRQRNVRKDDNINYFAKGISLTRVKAKSGTLEKNELEEFLMYYVNFLTLLPMNLLVNNNEGIQMKSEDILVMRKAFEKNNLKIFINKNYLKNYDEGDINLDNFFNSNYLSLNSFF